MSPRQAQLSDKQPIIMATVSDATRPLRTLTHALPPILSNNYSFFPSFSRQYSAVGVCPATIVGMKYCKGAGEGTTIRTGPKNAYRVIRQHDNAADPNALIVTTKDGAKIGFLRKSVAEILAAYLDGRLRVWAEVTHVPMRSAVLECVLHFFLRPGEGGGVYERTIKDAISAIRRVPV